MSNTSICRSWDDDMDNKDLYIFYNVPFQPLYHKMDNDDSYI